MTIHRKQALPLLLAITLLSPLAAHAQIHRTPQAPEIDASTGVAGSSLLLCGLAMLRRRKDKGV